MASVFEYHFFDLLLFFNTINWFLSVFKYHNQNSFCVWIPLSDLFLCLNTIIWVPSVFEYHCLNCFNVWMQPSKFLPYLNTIMRTASMFECHNQIHTNDWSQQSWAKCAKRLDMGWLRACVMLHWEIKDKRIKRTLVSFHIGYTVIPRHRWGLPSKSTCEKRKTVNFACG